MAIRVPIRRGLTLDPESSLATIDHYHHKLRRSALNHFFSTQSVRNLQPVLEERVNALSDALVKYATTRKGEPLNIMYPFSAFSNGVSPILSGSTSPAQASP